MEDFKSALQKLINKFSMENGSNTPDYVLADYLQGCLNLFDNTVKRRDRHYVNECPQEE